MARLRPFAITALAVWTLVVWTGRLGLAWGGDGSTAAKVGATIPVVVFVVLGVAALATVLRTASARLAGSGSPLALAFGLWTIGYWLVRLPMILVHDHPAGFKGVHTVLALGSWALAGWALRELRAARHEPGAETDLHGRRLHQVRTG